MNCFCLVEEGMGEKFTSGGSPVAVLDEDAVDEVLHQV